VDIILLNYNGFKFTPKCIETLYKNTDFPFNLIVVDNQSTDGSAEWLDFASHTYPNMTVHFNKQLDSGYAAGVNIGLQLSTAPYVCLLNNDILVSQKNWLRFLVHALKKDQSISIVSPKLLYPDKRIQYAGIAFNKNGLPYHIGRFKEADMFSSEREIPAATFACVLIKSELLKEGLDEGYLVGTFEDIDFCVKARFEGWKIRFCPQVTLCHYESATQFTRQKNVFALHQKVNAERFLGKWSSWLALNQSAFPEVYKK
jgi:GT2 family glycosyltransferase